MSNRYKLILSNKSIYREVDLSDAQTTVRVGTTTGCDVRLNKKLFFDEFDLTLSLVDGVWNLMCSDAVYVSSDGVRKLMVVKLGHGDHFQIYYRSSDNDLLAVDFMADFDYAGKDYNRQIDISGQRQFTIGADPRSSIQLRSEFLTRDIVSVENRMDSLFLKVQSSAYGIYKNGQRMQDGTATIHNRDFFSLGEYSFYYKDRLLYTTQSSGLTVNQMPSAIVRESKSALEYPKFNRNTRVLVKIPDEEIPVLDPPPKPKKPKKNLLLTILPSLLMIVMIVVLRGIMSNTGGNNLSYILMSAGMMGVGIFTSILTFKSENKAFQEECEGRIVSYKAYIEDKKTEIEKYRVEERDLMNHMYYDVEEDVQLANRFSGDLFNRRPEDEDFLRVRLGTGTIEAARKIGWKKQETLVVDDELASLPEQLAASFKTLYDAPIITDLKEANAIGVVGSTEACYGMLKNMTIDLAIRHYYKDVKLFYLISSEDCQRFRWLRYLPHVENDEIGMRNIAFDSDSRTSLFEYLYRVLSSRSGQKGPFQEIVVFAFDAKGIKSHPLSQFMENATELGVTFVFFDRDRALLPQFCKDLILLSSADKGVLLHTDDEDSGISFNFRVVPDAIAEQVAHRLAPIYCEEVSLESSLTKSITLFELLQIYSADDLDLSERWAGSAVDKSMAAPLGVKTKNEVVYLDLHEKYHGPHGLVAGTTGSGKSEILQSYILSMATLFHPYEVSFLIIDFKGGGMVNQFRNLPHLVGAITNIDGKEINRSLRSIKAELLKRQEYFSKADVNHIDKYIRKYKNGEVETPLPHLIIIVDEFAELKAEQPEFMKELISTARIGRSLGVHLILATQKPAGQVNDQIWSNSKFKLCLKVQTREDSNEVLKSPLAAEIKEPGRAYLQVGNNEIFDLFQSGFSGAPESTGEGIRQIEYKINSLDLSGKRHVVFNQKRMKGDENSRTQLEAIVDYVHAYCESEHIQQLQPICLPPLPKELPLEFKDESDKMSVQVGLADDPDHQVQFPVFVNMRTCKHLLIVGEAGSGKTTLVETILLSLVNRCSQQELNFYILDYSSRLLKMYKTLPHCGAVLGEDDSASLDDFFRMLDDIVSERKKLFSELEVSSYEMANALKPIPLIVVVIDNISGLSNSKAGESHAYKLNTYLKECGTYGVKYIITCNHTNDVNSRVRQEVGDRVALNLKDKFEYTEVVGCRVQDVPAALPGRGMINADGRAMETQFVMYEPKLAGNERTQSVRKMLEDWSANYRRESNVFARRLTTGILTSMTYEDFALQFAAKRIPLGYAQKGDKAVALPFKQFTMLTVYLGNPIGKIPLTENFLFAAKRDGMSLQIIKRNENSVFDLSNLEHVNPELIEGAEFYDGSKASINSFIQSINAEASRRKDILLPYCEENGLDLKQPDIRPLSFAHMSAETKPLLVVIENLADYSMQINAISSMLFDAIFKNVTKYNIYFLAFVDPEDCTKAKDSRVFWMFNPDRTVLLSGGQLGKQNLCPLAANGGAADKPIPYNQCLMYYHEGYHLLTMPCGEIQQESAVDEDDKSIF